MNEPDDPQSSETHKLSPACDHPTQLRLTPEQQLRFWRALQAPVTLTPAQRRLAVLVRGAR